MYLLINLHDQLGVEGLCLIPVPLSHLLLLRRQPLRQCEQLLGITGGILDGGVVVGIEGNTLVWEKRLNDKKV